MSKACGSAGYMRNPNTGRCIKIGGPTHSALLASGQIKKGKRVAPSSKNNMMLAAPDYIVVSSGYTERLIKDYNRELRQGIKAVYDGKVEIVGVYYTKLVHTDEWSVQKKHLHLFPPFNRQTARMKGLNECIKGLVRQQGAARDWLILKTDRCFPSPKPAGLYKVLYNDVHYCACYGGVQRTDRHFDPEHGHIRIDYYDCESG